MSNKEPSEVGAHAGEESEVFSDAALADDTHGLLSQSLNLYEFLSQDPSQDLTRRNDATIENEEEVPNPRNQSDDSDPERYQIHTPEGRPNISPSTSYTSELPSPSMTLHSVNLYDLLGRDSPDLSANPRNGTANHDVIQDDNCAMVNRMSGEDNYGKWIENLSDSDEEAARGSQETARGPPFPPTQKRGQARYQQQPLYNASVSSEEMVLPESSAQAARREINPLSLTGPRMRGSSSRESTTEKGKSSNSKIPRSREPSLASVTGAYNSLVEIQPSIPEGRNPSSNSGPQAVLQTTAPDSQQQDIPSSSIPVRSNGMASEIVLPRWQPDSEVDACPICGTAFNFFLRKHHCRKCGRVVCNTCSPHRITIPYQYIVQPPTDVYDCTAEHTRTRSRTISQNSSQDSDVGGGMRVRLCNPCVPDPNLGPPPASSITLNRPLPPLPPSNSPPQQPAARTSSARIQRSELCFICGDRLPPSTTAIENHIDRCINRHLRDIRHEDASGGTPAPSRPQLPSILEQQPHSSSSLPATSHTTHHLGRPRHTSEASTLGNIQDPDRNASTGQAASEAPPSRPFLSSRMICFSATHVDTVGEDNECIICMEDFEQGVEMARLECLCKYHKRCIDGWFFQHPGRCPVHGQDNY